MGGFLTKNLAIIKKIKLPIFKNVKFINKLTKTNI